MKLSVVIPVHNEKETIVEIIRRVKAVALDKEIIIVDDRSTDGTDQILREKFSGFPEIQLVFLETNRGKGFAIRSALQHVTGDIVIVQDADLEYDPEDYKQIVAPFQDQKAVVVYGSRFMYLKLFNYAKRWLRRTLHGESCDIGHVYFSNFLCIKLLNLLVFVLFGQRITDEATCYKAFKWDVLRAINLKCTRFEFCPEVTAKVCKAGHKIVEVPVSYVPRTTEHGKKIGWRDGLVAIWTLFRYRFKD